MKLKVCGMKYPENIKKLVEVQPDYVGFIFYPKSKRYMKEDLEPGVVNQIPEGIKKVGVFVNENFENIEKSVKLFQLDLLQLHGNESSEFCQQLTAEGYIVVKAFQVHDGFDFEVIEDYKPHCKYFLFDTQTPLYGGSGHKFNWKLLEGYDNEKAFFLSGGIDLEDAGEILNLNKLNIHAIDINSRFEIGPGLKDIEKVKKFKEQLNN